MDFLKLAANLIGFSLLLLGIMTDYKGSRLLCVCVAGAYVLSEQVRKVQSSVGQAIFRIEQVSSKLESMRDELSDLAPALVSEPLTAGQVPDPSISQMSR